MNPQVKQFDEEKAKAALKECPKIVRDYVKLLQQHIDKWKGISYNAISKLRENQNTPAK